MFPEIISKERRGNARPRSLYYMKTWLTPAGNAYNLYLDALAQSHLLIGGTTGSGKSVLVNGLVYTALFRAPTSAQFILIDPKRVELSQFRALPHVLRYASEPDTMPAALHETMNLTEYRFRTMSGDGVKTWTGGDVYVIIDELADLMTTNRKTVQPLLQRLCQLGRAARVHVIACTQCPISAVIPTQIKVNFDSRFCLRTRTAQDSRNVMEYAGAERLPRFGEGYYSTPEYSPPARVQIPYIIEEQISARVRFWTEQNSPPAFHLFKP